MSIYKIAWARFVFSVFLSFMAATIAFFVFEIRSTGVFMSIGAISAIIGIFATPLPKL